MKKTYSIAVKKQDGSYTQKGVMAADEATVTLPNPVPAAIVAILAALNGVGSGSEVMNLNFGSEVDIDATT